MAHRSDRASSPRDHRQHPIASSLFDCRPLPFLARKNTSFVFQKTTSPQRGREKIRSPPAPNKPGGVLVAARRCVVQAAPPIRPARPLPGERLASSGPTSESSAGWLLPVRWLALFAATRGWGSLGRRQTSICTRRLVSANFSLLDTCSRRRLGWIGDLSSCRCCDCYLQAHEFCQCFLLDAFVRGEIDCGDLMRV
jgi:hypothetical protein